MVFAQHNLFFFCCCCDCGLWIPADTPDLGKQIIVICPSKYWSGFLRVLRPFIIRPQGAVWAIIRLREWNLHQYKRNFRQFANVKHLLTSGPQFQWVNTDGSGIQAATHYTALRPLSRFCLSTHQSPLSPVHWNGACVIATLYVRVELSRFMQNSATHAVTNTFIPHPPRTIVLSNHTFTSYIL